jgi:hypothetical protein
MSNYDLREAAGVFLNNLSQLGHANQCETDNYTNSAACDCGLDAVKVEATAVIQSLVEALEE